LESEIASLPHLFCLPITSHLALQVHRRLASNGGPRLNGTAIPEFFFLFIFIKRRSGNRLVMIFEWHLPNGR
jgi:hypothetical protein